MEDEGLMSIILPAELKAEDVTAICDSREQLPLDLAPLKTVRGTLTTGDYSILGMENIVSLERKSLDDLLDGAEDLFGRLRNRLRPRAGFSAIAPASSPPS